MHKAALEKRGKFNGTHTFQSVNSGCHHTLLSSALPPLYFWAILGQWSVWRWKLGIDYFPKRKKQKIKKNDEIRRRWSTWEVAVDDFLFLILEVAYIEVDAVMIDWTRQREYVLELQLILPHLSLSCHASHVYTVPQVCMWHLINNRFAREYQGREKDEEASRCYQRRPSFGHSTYTIPLLSLPAQLHGRHI